MHRLKYKYNGNTFWYELHATPEHIHDIVGLIMSNEHPPEKIKLLDENGNTLKRYRYNTIKRRFYLMEYGNEKRTSY